MDNSEWKMSQKQIEMLHQDDCDIYDHMHYSYCVHAIETAVRLGFVIPVERLKLKAEDLRDDAETLELEHNYSPMSMYGASILVNVAEDIERLTKF